MNYNLCEILRNKRQVQSACNVDTVDCRLHVQLSCERCNALNLPATSSRILFSAELLGSTAIDVELVRSVPLSSGPSCVY